MHLLIIMSSISIKSLLFTFEVMTRNNWIGRVCLSFVILKNLLLNLCLLWNFIRHFIRCTVEWWFIFSTHKKKKLQKTIWKFTLTKWYKVYTNLLIFLSFFYYLKRMLGKLLLVNEKLVNFWICYWEYFLIAFMKKIVRKKNSLKAKCLNGKFPLENNIKRNKLSQMFSLSVYLYLSLFLYGSFHNYDIKRKIKMRPIWNL